MGPVAEKSRAFGLVSWSLEFEGGIGRFCALLKGAYGAVHES